MSLHRAVLWFAGLAILTLAGCGTGATLTPLEKANALLRENQLEAAVAACDEAIATNPENAIYICRGKTFVLLGDLDRAVADFTEAIRLKPGDSEAYYLRAMAYKDQGKHDLAVADD